MSTKVPIGVKIESDLNAKLLLLIELEQRRTGFKVGITDIVVRALEREIERELGGLNEIHSIAHTNRK